MDSSRDPKIKDELENNTQKVSDKINQYKKYSDDITMYIAYQNWCWMEYSWMLYTQMLHKNMQITNLTNQIQQYQNQQQSTERNNFQQQQQQQPHVEERVIFKLAPLSKRIAAEFIDFMLLALCKVFLIYYFYGDEYIEKFSYILVIDDTTSLSDLEDMLMQALLFRVIVIAYEGYMLSGTLPFSNGSTLGKRIMNLKVFYSNDVVDHNNIEQTVSIVPRPLGVLRSCFRAFLKSTCISFVFPVMLPVLTMFTHNRLIYDIAVDAVVVDQGVVER
ncbi:uncharacterized protein LOC100199969 [Hydra vulgaris]|uniref:Protein FAM8A1 n=1 Tax=Hydra vulgaris TaxID=6087 RepID=T2M4D2_HYDVU|nr:uncharacterized protein LOC100199969 [Hydra vulgaris]